MNPEQTNKQVEQILERLNLVKEEFIKDKNLLNISIRKDLVAIQLKDIIKNTNTREELVNQLNAYIQDLYKNLVIHNEGEMKDDKGK